MAKREKREVTFRQWIANLWLWFQVITGIIFFNRLETTCICAFFCSPQAGKWLERRA